MMKLFNRIPERLFSILIGQNKELYAEALFLLRDLFENTLIIRRKDVLTMLQSSLENSIRVADFSDEVMGESRSKETISVSEKASIMFRRLKETGWIETEYAKHSFEENVTIPDYAIQLINTFYAITVNEQREYNGYVYATYSALKSSEDNPDYCYQALVTAYQNTVRLIDELKSLFNNIKKYHAKVTDELGVNQLLDEHFNDYKEHIYESIYYPLKTIDSIPRFKTSIIQMVNEWWADEEIIDEIVKQGLHVKVYKNEEAGYQDVRKKINYIADTYLAIENLMASIDTKHIDYTNASIDKIRYLLNADRTIKGKLVHVLHHSRDETVLQQLENGIHVYQHTYINQMSLYTQRQQQKKNSINALPIVEQIKHPQQANEFFKTLNLQYSTKKVDTFILGHLITKDEASVAEFNLFNSEAFILTILGTIRGIEKQAPYEVIFNQKELQVNGYKLPSLVFKRKEKIQCL